MVVAWKTRQIKSKPEREDVVPGYEGSQEGGGQVEPGIVKLEELVRVGMRCVITHTCIHTHTSPCAEAGIHRKVS